MNATPIRHMIPERVVGLFVLVPIVAGCVGGTAGADPVASAASSQTTVSADESAARAAATQSARPVASAPSSSAKPGAAASSAPKRTTAGSPRPGAAPELMQSTSYFVIDDWSGQAAPKLVPVSRVVDKTPRGARAALGELLRGPDENERSVGIRTEIPARTKLLGLSVKNGLATVNLSRTFEADRGGISKGTRLAQIVYTLTRFSNVTKVSFLVEGKPSTQFDGQGIVGKHAATRDEFLDYLPNIFVDSPSFHSYTHKVDGVRIAGKSIFRKPEFRLTVLDRDSGVTLADVPVRARCGTLCWSDFDVTVPLELAPDQSLMLQVSTRTAEGGAEDIRTYYVQAGDLPKLENAPADDDYSCGC